MLTCEHPLSGSSARKFLLCPQYRLGGGQGCKQRIKTAPGGVDAAPVHAGRRARR